MSSVTQGLNERSIEKKYGKKYAANCARQKDSLHIAVQFNAADVLKRRRNFNTRRSIRGISTHPRALCVIPPFFRLARPSRQRSTIIPQEILQRYL